MFCPFCGNETADGAVFCPSCGKPVPGAAKQPAGGQTPPPEPEAQLTPEQPAYQQPEQPSQPAYQQPEQPSQPAYRQPDQPPYEQTEQTAPVYQQPAQPVQPAYQQPAQPAYKPPDQPAQPASQQPGQPYMQPGFTADASKKSSKMLIAIVIAAAVVVLGVLTSLALFTDVFGDTFKLGASKSNTAATTEETSAKTAETSTAKAEAEATTKAAEPETTTKQQEPAAGGRKSNPALESLFTQLNIKTYKSNDISSRGLLEETLVNLANGVLGSMRNSVSADSRSGGDYFGLELGLGFDVTDAYMNDLVTEVMGPYGADSQIMDVLRLLAASEFKFSTEIGGETVNSMLNPVIGVNVNWLVQSRSLLSANAYADLDDIVFALPGLSDKVFWMASNLDAIPVGDIDELRTQMAAFDNMGEYIDKLMPYVEKMVIAAVGEIKVTAEGKEEVKLGGKQVTLDAIDIELTQESLSKAALAALNVLNDNREVYDIVAKAWNEVAESIPDIGQIDAQTLSIGVSGAIAQLSEAEEYFDPDDVMRLRLYVSDGMLAGMAMSAPAESAQLGYVTVKNTGYSFWYNNLAYSESADIESKPPVNKDPGTCERYEFYGSLSEGANGVSGDICLFIRENDDTFDHRLLTFSDVGVKPVFGAPAPTGKVRLAANDWLDAFVGQEQSSISFVEDMAYALDDEQAQQLLKDLEFAVILTASGNEYKMAMELSNPAKSSKVELALKAYLTNDKITPPQGDRVDIANADPEALMDILTVARQNLDSKIDALTAAGYNLEWLKPMISSFIDEQLGIGAGYEEPDTAGEGYSDGDYNGEYIFNNSDTEFLDAEEVVKQYFNGDVTLVMLRFGRNEIYARHGWVFEDDELQLYFNQQYWYYPIYDNDSIELNQYEEANVQILQALEDALAEYE